MPKIRLILEDISEEQAEDIREKLSHLAGCTVTIVPNAAVMPELTPEQQKAFEEEWSKPGPGNIVWRTREELEQQFPNADPGPAIGDAFTEHLTDIDADESLADIRTRIRGDVARLCGMITHLEMQLAAEGAHTEAANAEIDRLKAGRGEPAAWRWVKSGEVRWAFGAYPPTDAFKVEPLYV